MAMNIGEIARLSGVSRSTVSYALSGKRPVSDETRQRIEKVIKDSDYRPNAAARALKEGRTRTLGLVIPPAGASLTHIQLEFVAGVVEAAAQADLDVLLSSSGGNHERSFERLVSGRRVDGLILMEIRLHDLRVDRLGRTNVPFVGIGRTANPEAMCWVDVDYAALIARCVHHLADLGHRQIALINRSAELIAAGYGPGLRGRQGFVDSVAERGIAGIELACADDAGAGQATVERLLAEHPEVTAIATLNEAALPGIQHALVEAGRSVPADFSVAGVAARRWAEEFRPALTSADVPAAEMATRAVELLIERIAAPQSPPRHLLLAPPISLRSSTAPAPPART
ncbi:DNA-binding LacI/PurR family transcriptional regulator [Kitasatospora gansuensis]|uniref:DNA-binding LacI/PurR family transcriptional regulator n=1 Tax=Kitasatospora gansuensis TaxID=258050 RepID=A0A7W7WFN9_9ACTN|nr:LacI family DNA-binding transcriptional regulator [Kitasatospora gansuensis]MBB4945972.1 DNA-binding LacI/PurR family transcriptional regulator [Kitasatospora gansuensis]